MVDRVLERFAEVHGDRYDYSVMEYTKMAVNIDVICNALGANGEPHGVFQIRPANHIRGQGCQKCSRLIHGRKQARNTADFIEDARAKHGDKFNYDKVVYVGNKKKVIITCPTHGDYTQTPEKHLDGVYGCAACSCEVRSLHRRKTTEDWIRQATEVHGDTYDYSRSEYETALINVNIICKTHGEFKQMPNVHLLGRGCSRCKHSKGVNTIKDWLDSKGYNYNLEFKFDDCRNIHKLPFDIAIVREPTENPEIIALCEYDGIQHFEPVKGWGGEEKMLRTQHNDRIKDEYAAENEIPLVRIRYDEDIIKCLNDRLLPILQGE